jgi:hypothetical protein
MDGIYVRNEVHRGNICKVWNPITYILCRVSSESMKESRLIAEQLIDSCVSQTKLLFHNHQSPDCLRVKAGTAK